MSAGSVIVFDTETTGRVDPQIIEAAWIVVSDIDAGDGSFSSISRFAAGYRPDKPIELGAMATHGIIEDDLTGCAPHTDFKLPDGVDIIIGHNIDYDWEAAGKPDVRRICTLALARKLWPDLDSHTQSALLYHLHDHRIARALCKNAHSAEADVENLTRVLAEIVRKTHATSWDHLYEISEAARIPDTMPFGKHKGVPIAEVPRDYMVWLMKQENADPYVIQAFKNTIAPAVKPRQGTLRC